MAGEDKGVKGARSELNKANLHVRSDKKDPAESHQELLTISYGKS